VLVHLHKKTMTIVVSMVGSRVTHKRFGTTALGTHSSAAEIATTVGCRAAPMTDL
jgi:hypothetical protein